MTSLRQEGQTLPITSVCAVMPDGERGKGNHGMAHQDTPIGLAIGASRRNHGHGTMRIGGMLIGVGVRTVVMMTGCLMTRAQALTLDGFLTHRTHGTGVVWITENNAMA